MNANKVRPIVVAAVIAMAVAALLASGDAASAAGTTDVISVGLGGSPGNGYSCCPQVTADGRYVVFASVATDLVPDGGSFGLFVRDRTTGATERILNGVPVIDFDISGDGRYVAFTSQASDLVPNDTNTCDQWVDPGTCPDVFLYDRENRQTVRVSVASDGTEGNGWSDSAKISGDGRYVVFVSGADNLAPGDITYPGYPCLTGPPHCFDVFVHDRVTGLTELASVGSDGSKANSNSFSPSVSATGRFVSFFNQATNLSGAPPDSSCCVYLRDRQSGTTEIVSLDNSGNLPNNPFGPGDTTSAISADGRYVAFGSEAPLVSDDTSLFTVDVFVRDRLSGSTERVSVASDGTEANGDSFSPLISADARYVVFTSGASNLAPNDANTCGGFFPNCPDVFIHDRHAGETERVSVASDGNEGNADSWGWDITDDGRYLAFESEASNLALSDTNRARDVFVRDRCPDGSCGGGPTPTPEPRFVSYVASGDSIPSGVDLGEDCAHDPGGQETNCRANPALAYPQFLIERIYDEVTEGVGLVNVACSGATTKEFIGGVDERICPSSEGKSQLDYIKDSAVPPDVVTLTVGADDYALTELLKQCRGKLESLDFRGAAKCSDDVLQNAPASLAVTGQKLETILNELTQARPNAIVAVTNYYNPAPLALQDICLALPAFYGGCRFWVLDPLNRLLENANALVQDLDLRIAATVHPFTEATGGRVQLVSLYDQFAGHCGFNFSFTFTVKVRGQAHSTPTGQVGCDASASWIAPRREYQGEGTKKLGPIEVQFSYHAGVHPNVAGHQCIASEIWNTIRDDLGVPGQVTDACP